VHVGNGDVIENGTVIVEGGRIVRIGSDLPVPEGAKVIDLADGAITPGLIDAHAALEPTAAAAVESRGAPYEPPSLFGSDFGLGSSEAEREDPAEHCPLESRHEPGETCPVCGSQNAPPLAVGARLTPSAIESSSEVIPHTRIIDSVNLRSPDFDRLVRGGVTTVFVAPDPAAVIGSQGAIVRTGGPMNERIVRDTADIMATMGADPSYRGGSNRLPVREFVTFMSRRPTTRMGVTWVFRKALHDTRRFEQGIPTYGADTPSTAAMQTLTKVLAGDIGLRIQARMRHDIFSALRLADEFGLSFTLVEATEAYHCIEELKASETSVIYGPIFVDPPGWRAITGEADRARLHTLKALLDAGVTTALTAHELRDEDGLARQAMYARRCGASLADATRCVTETPARMLGLADEIGTLESGKRADIVLWNGKAFDGTSQPTVVMIGGEVVMDRREG
jgi:imidazolonepropionase-like amidohydrolase